MADGGASTFIMLITGLLISSSVSALLITEWSAMARAAQKTQQGITFTGELGLDFAGDPMMVDVDTTGTTPSITFYLQNTGVHPLDEQVVSVLVNGEAPTSVSATITGTTWDPNELAEIVIEDTSYGTTPFASGEDVNLYAIATSEVVGGMSSSASRNVEVRLS
jgi:archaellum component FlaG (FlaF/FlaG flagellin family)